MSNLNNSTMQRHGCVEEEEEKILPEEIKRRQGLEVSQKWGRRRHTSAGNSAEDLGSFESFSHYDLLTLSHSRGCKWVGCSDKGVYRDLGTD